MRTPEAAAAVAPTGDRYFDNGNTIEVETHGANLLTLDGVVYELKQFHFHTPSEHRVNGRGYDTVQRTMNQH